MSKFKNFYIVLKNKSLNTPSIRIFLLQIDKNTFTAKGNLDNFFIKAKDIEEAVDKYCKYCLFEYNPENYEIMTIESSYCAVI